MMERLLSTTCILTLLAAGLAMGSAAAAPGGIPGKPPGKGEDTVGNNLSFPVIFSDGVEKATRYPTDWSTGNPIPAPQFGGAFTTIGEEDAAVDWYHQQDPLNLWGAETFTYMADPAAPDDFIVDWIDWGDNLEARDWNVNSVVRVETVLYRDLADEPVEPGEVPQMVAYTMRYLSGEGPNEMWGANGETFDSNQATVYSHCARLTIQRLTTDRDDPDLDTLEWNDVEHQWNDGGTGLIESPVFNLAVWEAGDGPGFYNAENNVPGKIIYGYNWNVRKTGKVAGDYRLTYSLDDQCTQAGKSHHAV